MPEDARRILIVCISILVFMLSFAGCVCVDNPGPPRSAVYISVVDSEGAPVPGAELTIYEGGTRRIAYSSPISNYTSAQALSSDEKGDITAIKKEPGPASGGCYLFGVMPMGVVRKPGYDCEIAAAGYKTIRFDFWDLFKSSGQQQTDLPETTVPSDAGERGLRVYVRQFVLEK